MPATCFALIAIGLWASLASLGVLLSHVPPFLLTGVALLIGSMWAWPAVWRDPTAWRVSRRVLALGVVTLFGFHFFLFLGLRMASSVEVNLVNYLWPLLIVVMAPWYLERSHTHLWQLVAAALGFIGAAIAIRGAQGAPGGEWVSGLPQAVGWKNTLGYFLALVSACLWANYSLQTRRLADAGQAFPTSAIGLFCLVSGILSLVCHAAMEPTPVLTGSDMGLLLLMGLGPLGAAFYAWDKALKTGDARVIGILSYLTPLLSTALLMVVTHRSFNGSIGLAALLIIGAAILGAATTPSRR